jgi:hypothetical protein
VSGFFAYLRPPTVTCGLLQGGETVSCFSAICRNSDPTCCLACNRCSVHSTWWHCGQLDEMCQLPSVDPTSVVDFTEGSLLCSAYSPNPSWLSGSSASDRIRQKGKETKWISMKEEIQFPLLKGLWYDVSLYFGVSGATSKGGGRRT